MQRGKFNVVVDGQWGSCGKGLISTALADRYRPEIVSTTNQANAGHTSIDSEGLSDRSFIGKVLPTPAVLNAWRDGEYNPFVVIGPTASFFVERLLEELKECNVKKSFVHPRAGIILQRHKDIESQLDIGTKHIASTMQGCGAFMSDKIMRKAGLQLARDIVPNLCNLDELAKAFDIENNQLSMPRLLMSIMDNTYTILHEGSQGFSLCINHGSHYPFCTSRSTTSLQNAADMGIPPAYVGDVYLVIRPAPIRVGNITENDEITGYSGGCYSDHEETSWSDIAKNAGAPEDVMKGELTTVTKRLRRVFTFSKQQIIEAAAINGATKIVLNFANYIDWSCYKTNEWDKLPRKVLDFISMLEDITSVPVTIVGTGPRNNHVCFR